MATSTTAYANCVILHLEHPMSSPAPTSGRESNDSHLGRCEGVSSDGITDMEVTLTYFITEGCIEVIHQIEYRVHEYEVSICEEECGGA